LERIDHVYAAARFVNKNLYAVIAAALGTLVIVIVVLFLAIRRWWRGARRA
jgi:multidrug efflux pump subunit AcrB